MIDFRYHIYSLAAVFLALAVGIVVGTSFARNYPSSEISRDTIKRYEWDMRDLKSEIQSKVQESEKSEALAKEYQVFCRAAWPIVVKDELAGEKVAIIRTGDYGQPEGSVSQAVETAGAQVTSVTVMSRTFPFDDNERIDRALVESGFDPGGEGVGPQDKLFGAIAETICSGRYSDTLPRLEEAGVAEFSGDYRRHNDLIVLVGGASTELPNTTEGVDSQLIVQFDRLGVTVVGCEGSRAVSSYVPEWHRKGIATVDNADTATGQLAIVYALKGEMANFGFKDTADRLIPKSLETE